MSDVRPAGSARSSLRLRRSGQDWLVAGVCGGLGRRLGVDPVVLRLALLALVLASGAGVLIYLALWALSEDEVDSDPDAESPAPSHQQSAAVALFTLGLLVLFRTIGLWFGDGVVWPVTAAVLGSGLLWARGDSDRLSWLRRPPAQSPLPTSIGSSLAEAGVVRVVGGGVLVASGMVAALAANDRTAAVRDLLLAVAIALTGLALVLGPWMSRLVTELGAERRERIRNEERAEMAAHLHDSVLQTLALIQRSADEPGRSRALARRQERELRAWLYGRGEGGGARRPTTISNELARLATDIEDHHDVRVEIVVVGDRAVDEAVRPVLAAVREAVTNAARYAGVAVVHVFVEAGDHDVTATVRDRGSGFDPDAVGDDRHGIRHSIRGRVAQAGGTAVLLTNPGEGTEWDIRVPHSAPRTSG